MSNTDKILILMATKNGQKYLPDQLESIRGQSHNNWRLIVSDDNSTDKTLAILKDFQDSLPVGHVVILRGPNKGSAANFFSLIARAPIGSTVALCDQDDVWKKDKLSRAFEKIRQLDAQTPVLYGCRLAIFENKLEKTKVIEVDRYSHSFRHAVVQNGISGNTIVLNSAALEALQKSDLNADVHWHDWWIYLFLIACGATIVADNYEGIYYRKHEANLVGPNSGYRVKASRLKQLFNGNFVKTCFRNFDALHHRSHMLLDENKVFVSKLAKENPTRLSLFITLLKLRIRRQKFHETIAIYLAFLLFR